jgi:SAM-dependent methyltransferase
MAADMTGWRFDWLDGRATEERPPWGYARLLSGKLAGVTSALDVDTGGGEVIGELRTLPPNMFVTESWPPNVERARELLGSRGVTVVQSDPGGQLPFDAGNFELVTARHPNRPDWSELHRVLEPGGRYFAQHVGPASAFELIEWFRGPLSRESLARDPRAEAAAAERAGFTIIDLRTARCRMEFFDIGAVVWILRKCVWWVPDFDPVRDRDRLLVMDALMRSGQPFVAHSTRHLIEARA